MRFLGHVRPHVNDALAAADGPGHVPAGDLHDEGRGRSRALLDAVVVDAALVAHGAFRDEPQVAARARGAPGLERGGFEQDVGRVVGDLGVEAAHHAGERHRAALGRGDDGHVGGKRALDVVERGERAAVFGLADDHMGAAVFALQLVQVERMERLAEQEQDVVRHVDDVVDGALADRGEAFHHPVGRGPHLHAADDAGGIARAADAVLDGDVDVVLAVFDEAELRGHFRQRIVPVLAIHRAHLARKARDGEAVGAVRRDFQVEHRVGHVEVLGDGLAHRRVVGEDPDAVVVLADAQLALRTAHAAARDAAQLRLLDLEVAGQNRADRGDGELDARLDVRGAAHDLQRLFLPDVHRDDVHVVAVGVRFARLDVAHDHAIERGAERFHALDAGAGQIQLIAERLRVGRNLHVFAQPFQRYLHVFLFLECSLPRFELGGHTPCSNSPELARTAHWAVRLVRNCAWRTPAELEL